MPMARALSRRKQGGDRSEKPLANSLRSCDSVLANVPLRTAVPHADCDRHELVRTIKLCANCDVALATARCSYLTELQMGNLHGKAPTQKICPQKNSPRAVKFNFFSSWTINGPAIPILGCIVYHRDRGRCATPPHKKSPAETGLMELRRNRRDSKETPQTIDFPGIVARKCPASKRG